MKKFLSFLAVVAAVAGGAWYSTKGTVTVVAPVVPAQPAATSTVSSAPADKPKALAYKNGTYTAVGRYDSPAGVESISITLTIKDDVITAASGINQAGDGRSSQYQDMFLSGFVSSVVGKTVDSVRLTKISRSSLTPAGFNDALSKIKVEAKA
jgi:uncharacterized protein with FMN-binding domain